VTRVLHSGGNYEEKKKVGVRVAFSGLFQSVFVDCACPVFIFFLDARWFVIFYCY
jgi:hypothetical protein